MSEKWDKNNPRVPFARTGQWMDVVLRQRDGTTITQRQWVPDPIQLWKKMNEYPYYNYEFRDLPNFHAQLKFETTTRGRSAATSWWRDTSTGVLYPVSFGALTIILEKATIRQGTTNLMEWKAAKRGANYTIMPA